MKNYIYASLIALTITGVSATAFAAELKVGAADTVESVLKGQAGSRVVVRLRSGQELTGTVRMVNNRIVQLGGLAGREFFDAVVPLEAVDAVMVRTKD